MKRYIQLITGGLLTAAGVTGLAVTYPLAAAYARPGTQMPAGLLSWPHGHCTARKD
jgi:hypothetical protein